jgi:hypothetical protein
LVPTVQAVQTVQTAGPLVPIVTNYASPHNLEKSADTVNLRPGPQGLSFVVIAGAAVLEK